MKRPSNHKDVRREHHSIPAGNLGSCNPVKTQFIWNCLLSVWKPNNIKLYECKVGYFKISVFKTFN